MSEILRTHAPSYTSDYAAMAANGLAYGRESSGFHGWLKKGVPEPADPSTLFAELRSVSTPPVLWATGGWVGIPTAFLVTHATRVLFEKHAITGITWAPVQIVKVATKGRLRRRPEHGEPEYQILKAKNLASQVGPLPVLWGVRIEAMTQVSPDRGAWDERASKIEPYHFAVQPQTDLWHAARGGNQYGGQAFCRCRFRDLCERHQLANIAFTRFSEWKSQVFG